MLTPLKKCKRCQKVFPLIDPKTGMTNFWKHDHTKDKLQQYCKGCIRTASRLAMRRYNARKRSLTEGAYQAMLYEQGGQCLDCRKLAELGVRRFSFCLADPAHKNGLRCAHCHRMLKIKLRRDIERVEELKEFERKKKKRFAI